MLGRKEVAPMPTSTRDRAVVLGGGIAGLLAARVLADTYAQVTIVERDVLPATASHRRGAPQARHVHGLLPRGREIMEDLLPGLTDELVLAGALPGDVCGNVRWYLGGRMLRQADSGLLALSASRPLIEDALRNRIRALTNVSIMDGFDIVGLRPSIDLRRVVGVRVTGTRGQGSRILPADLVVDATGRGSRTPLWLTELGYPEPETDRVTINLSYSTRIFAAPRGLLGRDVVVATSRFPGQRRSSVLQQLEDGNVLVTLAGILGERPPTDLAGFTEYARSLPVPDTYEVIRASQPVGDAVPFRFPSYVRQRYERLTWFPAGLLVLGDAVGNLNPIYGQGMSVAALHAAVLREHLGCGDEPEPQRFFAGISAALDAPWNIAVGADASDPDVVATARPESALPPGYLPRLQLAAAEDGELAVAFLRVTSLVDPPSALVRPEIVARVESAEVPATA
jgi:2-polyprenyl-6-methoxyphenol hydroxylase-like FAD-dependent oxidoreductase